MLDPNRFVKERRKYWSELERELERIAAGQFKRFDVPRARRLGELYRRTSADLIRARSETANSELIDYLDGLVGRAYGVIYRGKRMRLRAAFDFLAFGFPAIFRRRFKPILAAGLILFAGLVFGFLADYFDSSARYYLAPQMFLEPHEAMIQQLKKGETPDRSLGGGSASFFSSQLMANNIRVGFLSFALGATAGIGTVYVLFYNGAIVGTIGNMYVREGFGLYFWAHLLPHGVIELTCIFIAGGAGFLIARALVAPGVFGRGEALKRYGGEGVQLILGASFLLIFAGISEAFITPQTFIPHSVKLLYATMTLVGLVAYLGYNERILGLVGLAPPEALSRSKLEDS